MSITVISGGIFNFVEGDYSPPMWSGDVYLFGFYPQLYQIWTDEDYVFAATIKGLDIYDIEFEKKYAYISYGTGFSTVWASDEHVFLGTTASGVKYINKTCISGSVYNPVELSVCLNDFSTFTPYHNLTSDNIRYIHGNNDLFMCCTDLGVDVIKMEPQGYRSYTTVSGAQKCFMTSSGKFYYTVSGTEGRSLNRVNYSLWDWSEPDYSYTTGGGVLPAGEKINDIFITENTSENGIDNTLFVATTSGVYVIDEETLLYDTYYTKTVSGTYNILEGVANNFVAVWADENASRANNKFYVPAVDAFSIVDLGTKELFDYYTTSHAGACGESLDAEDIVDTNVTM